MVYSTLKRKTPLKQKTPLKAYSTLRAKKSLRQCTIDKARASTSLKKAHKRAYKPKRSYESIFTSELSKCFLTGCTSGWYNGENGELTYYKIHIHHIFGASNKANSEKYHFLIPLRDDWHNMSSYGVHTNRDLELRLKKICQEYWLLAYGTKEDFIKTFGMWWD